MSTVRVHRTMPSCKRQARACTPYSALSTEYSVRSTSGGKLSGPRGWRDPKEGRYREFLSLIEWPGLGDMMYQPAHLFSRRQTLFAGGSVISEASLSAADSVLACTADAAASPQPATINCIPVRRMSTSIRQAAMCIHESPSTLLTHALVASFRAKVPVRSIHRCNLRRPAAALAWSGGLY